MSYRNIKTFLAVIAVIGAGIVSSVPAFALQAETEETAVVTTALETEEAEVMTVPETSDDITDVTIQESEDEQPSEAETEAENEDTPSETTAETEETIGTTDTTSIPENPYKIGMLSNDDFYRYLMEFLDDPANFDFDGSGVLIGEEILHDDSAPESDKTLYTITTRGGNIFYLIIDRAMEGQNVYFLNKVDFTDLAALIDTDKENLTAAEKNIRNKANAGAVTKAKEENPEGEEKAPEVTLKPIDELPAKDGVKPDPDSFSIDGAVILYIVMAVIAAAIIFITWYKKVGGGKNSNKGFDEPEETDENEQYAEENEGDDTDEADDEAESDDIDNEV